MPVDAQALWADKYAARFNDAKLAEDLAREQAFVNDTHLVYGERVRSLTPRDLLHLQAVGSPVIYGHADISPADIMLFLWAIHTRNRGPWFMRYFQRGRMIGRVLARRSENPVDDAVSEIAAYVSGMFMDAPGGAAKDGKPFGACWLAPIMVRLSAKVGPADPMDGCAWADTPMPRIWQYIKAARAAEEPKFKDFSPSDRIMSEWMQEVNGSIQEEKKNHV